MNKVICDVCGTAYPETEPRCPICDCVRAEGGQTSAGDTGESTYTYTKGGRFSKSNVRKRLKAKQMNEEDELLVKAAAVEPEDDQDDEDLEDELDSVSNRGLIIIVILLLLAIIAVSSYLVVEFFKAPEEKNYTQSTTSSVETPNGGEEDPEDDKKPCMGFNMTVESVTLTEVGQTKDLMEIVQTKPLDTTDTLTFESSDTAVVTVDANGVITVVGAGEAVIIIRCGEAETEMVVVCDIEVDDPVVDDPVVDDPVVDDPEDKFELRYADVTLDAVYPTLQLYSGPLDPAQITWASSNEKVVTVKDGVVTPVSRGSANITAKYDGKTLICTVRVSQEALDKLGVGQETPDIPDTPDTPDQPDEPEQPKTYHLKKDGSDPKWKIDGRDNTADVTLVLGGAAHESSCALTVVDGDGNTVAITWNLSNTNVVEYDAESGKFVAKGAGKVTLTASYDGSEFEAIIRVN